MKIGFDCNKYLEKQSHHILERINKFNNKLYLEFGGKLFDDFHASRVLPGFAPNAKISLLQQLKDKVEIIFVINAQDIENNKIRADIGITYDLDVLRQIDNIREMGLLISSVVICQYTGQVMANNFKNKLERRGERVYIHTPIEGYPACIDLIVSDEGYGKNPYIETSKPLVVVTAPGPGSGKMATCLSQLYHEYKHGIKAGYAKFETFPIWNLPLKHPVNLAYEAATADLNDVNMIDPFHLEAYGDTAVNYNRDIDIFPVVRTILEKITGDATLYKSPTDMGVNMAGYAIFDDDAVCEASKQEILRRYYKTLCDHKKGRADMESVYKIELLMKQLDITKEDRKVVAPAINKMKKDHISAVAIQLPDGQFVTGKTTQLMSAGATAILNSIKVLAGIDDEVLLISPTVLEPIQKLKTESLGSNNQLLTVEEILIALSICAATNETAALAISQLGKLKNSEAHATYIMTENDESMFRKLGINLTSEPIYPLKTLYYV